MASEAQQEEFEDWQHHDDSEDNFCDPEGTASISLPCHACHIGLSLSRMPHWPLSVADSNQGELSYVDLSINPERFTGYAGHSAHRVWEAIYKENCFRCVHMHTNE